MGFSSSFSNDFQRDYSQNYLQTSRESDAMDLEKQVLAFTDIDHFTADNFKKLSQEDTTHALTLLLNTKHLHLTQHQKEEIHNLIHEAQNTHPLLCSESTAGNIAELLNTIPLVERREITEATFKKLSSTEKAKLLSSIIDKHTGSDSEIRRKLLHYKNIKSGNDFVKLADHEKNEIAQLVGSTIGKLSTKLKEQLFNYSAEEISQLSITERKKFISHLLNHASLTPAEHNDLEEKAKGFAIRKKSDFKELARIFNSLPVEQKVQFFTEGKAEKSDVQATTQVETKRHREEENIEATKKQIIEPSISIEVPTESLAIKELQSISHTLDHTNMLLEKYINAESLNSLDTVEAEALIDESLRICSSIKNIVHNASSSSELQESLERFALGNPHSCFDPEYGAARLHKFQDDIRLFVDKLKQEADTIIDQVHNPALQDVPQAMKNSMNRALYLYEASLKYAPQDLLITKKIADILFEAKKYDKALQTYTKIIENSHTEDVDIEAIQARISECNDHLTILTPPLSESELDFEVAKLHDEILANNMELEKILSKNDFKDPSSIENLLNDVAKLDNRLSTLTKAHAKLTKDTHLSLFSAYSTEHPEFDQEMDNTWWSNCQELFKRLEFIADTLSKEPTTDSKISHAAFLYRTLAKAQKGQDNIALYAKYITCLEKLENYDRILAIIPPLYEKILKLYPDIKHLSDEEKQHLSEKDQQVVHLFDTIFTQYQNYNDVNESKKDYEEIKGLKMLTSTLIRLDDPEPMTQADRMSTGRVLHPIDQAYIRLYTTNVYKFINPVLSGSLHHLDSNLKELNSNADAADIIQEVNAVVPKICEALNKIPSFQGTVYRGLALTKEEIELLKTKTKKIERKAFQSFDEFDNVPKDFAMRESSKHRKEGAIFAVNCTKGKPIYQYSSYKPLDESFCKEKEVLYLPGASFEVESYAYNPEDNLHYFTLKEVDQNI